MSDIVGNPAHAALTEASRSKVFTGLDDYANAIAGHIVNGQWSGARALFNQVPQDRRPYVTWRLTVTPELQNSDAVERLVILHVD